MPQHPQYANSPSKNLDNLFDLLSVMTGYGFFHEDMYSLIDEIMFDLYPQAAKLYAQDYLEQNESEDQDISGEDEVDYFNELGVPMPSTSELYFFVNAEEDEQFIQDLRNVIAHCFHTDTYSAEGVSQEIIELRDIEYYRMHVHIEEDTETIKKYEYKNKTVWFPASVTPSRVGIYEISKHGHENPKHGGYAYWNGHKWHDSCILFKDCVNQKRSKKSESWSNYCWRGFLNQVSDDQ